MELFHIENLINMSEDVATVASAERAVPRRVRCIKQNCEHTIIIVRASRVWEVICSLF